MRAKYILSEVMVGLWRNVTMTVAMIITMAVSLSMLGARITAPATAIVRKMLIERMEPLDKGSEPPGRR